MASSAASSSAPVSTSSRSRSSGAGARSSRWYSSFGIRSMRSRSAGSRASRGPYLTITQCQPAASNIDCEPAGGDVGHDAVERLAVEVDDPHHLAELAHHRIGDRLPTCALVELGVADQRDLASADRHVEVPGDVAVRERAPHRRRRAEPDGPGGVVDRVGVLGPRRVGLEPAELAQRRQVGAVEPPEQVVERVQDRRRVRLHADAVGRLEHAEPQRGHQRHHRRARRLVPAHLHARAVRPHAVGVVDDRRRQPQHAALHLVEHREVELRLGACGRGHARHGISAAQGAAG